MFTDPALLSLSLEVTSQAEAAAQTGSGVNGLVGGQIRSARQKLLAKLFQAGRLNPTFAPLRFRQN